MSAHFLSLSSAAVGAIAQELAHWHVLRRRLQGREYQRTLRSPWYWAITLLMIGVSTVGSWLWFLPTIEAPRTYLLAGAAFPMLIKRAIAVFLQDESTLGAEEPKQALRSYFQAS